MQKKQLKSNDNLLDVYYKQIKAFPLLSFEEELELSRQIQETLRNQGDVSEFDGNCPALHKLVNSNLRLVIKIAGLFNVPGISIMDMIQEGNIGLIHAAKKFDYRKNVRFCSYASWWIRQFISRYIINKRRMVRLPERKEETLRKIQQTYHVLCQSLMHQPNSVDIANELGISVQDVDSYVNMSADSLSFERNMNDDENISAVDFHEDYTYNPERSLMKQASVDGTMRVLNNLMDKEKRIISYRYQLNGCERHTLREIGDKLDISPETVRQIEQRALKKIRSHANELRECIYEEAM
ncbi:MAG: RNA polymerase sigma factor RpoD/SigA [Treponema sp.]|nr:RNA polymerase sigma factor RpoD/SigA [Treponema sp.]